MPAVQVSATGLAKYPVFRVDVAEKALAHVIENKIEAAYRRGDLFDKRRKMMQAWADYVDNEQAGVAPVNTLEQIHS